MFGFGQIRIHVCQARWIAEAIIEANTYSRIDTTENITLPVTNDHDNIRCMPIREVMPR